MTQKQIPGPKSREWLERGIPLFRDGLRYRKDLEQAASRGFDVASQIIVDRAEGDFVWDVDDRRYIDFQNGWATNPVGNANPEIIDAVDAAHRRYGFHYDHPLRYELAERLAEIMPNQALPRFNFEVSGTDAAEAAVHLALTRKQRRYGSPLAPRTTAWASEPNSCAASESISRSLDRRRDQGSLPVQRPTARGHRP